MVPAVLRVEVVAAGPAGFGDQLFAAEFAQVVGGLPDGVAGVAGHGVDLGGELGDGEAVGCGGQREDRGQRGRGCGAC